MSLFERLFGSPGSGQELTGLGSRRDRKRYSRAAKLFKKGAFAKAREQLLRIDDHTARVDFLMAQTHKALADAAGRGSCSWSDFAEASITAYWNAVRLSRTAARGGPTLTEEEQEKATQDVMALASAMQGSRELPAEESRKRIYAEFAELLDSGFLEGLPVIPGLYGAVSLAPIMGAIMQGERSARATAMERITSRHGLTKWLVTAIELEGQQHRWPRRPPGS